VILCQGKQLVFGLKNRKEPKLVLLLEAEKLPFMQYNRKEPK